MILHDGQRFSRSSCLLFTGVVLSFVGGSSVPYTVALYKGPLDSERETGFMWHDGTFNLANAKQAEPQFYEIKNIL